MIECCPTINYYFGMKLKTCFADVLMFIVAKTQKFDTLKISKFLLISFFCVYKVFQCTALGAALDNCVFLLPEEYLTHRLNNYCNSSSMTWFKCSVNSFKPNHG